MVKIKKVILCRVPKCDTRNYSTQPSFVVMIKSNDHSGKILLSKNLISLGVD